MVINGHTDVYGLIGCPVEHTVSPVLHAALARAAGLNLVYVPFLVKQDLGLAVRGAYELNVRGLNVTVPYKRDVLPYLKAVDESASVMGAVNTLVRTDGGYIGYNTDYAGLIRAVRADRVTLSGRPVLVIGAGGAARAAVFAAASGKPSSILIVNRTPEKARALSSEAAGLFPGIRFLSGSLEEAGALLEETGAHAAAFQCTSAGLYPDTESCAIRDPSVFRRIDYGFDLIYSPEETVFLRKVREEGAQTRNGLAMLLYQGIASFELWTGKKVSEEAAAEAAVLLKEAVRR